MGNAEPSTIGRVYLNVGDEPGVRNWGRVRVEEVSAERVGLWLLDANGGAGCPGGVPPDVFERYFVESQ